MRPCVADARSRAWSSSASCASVIKLRRPLAAGRGSRASRDPRASAASNSCSTHAFGPPDDAGGSRRGGRASQARGRWTASAKGGGRGASSADGPSAPAPASSPAVAACPRRPVLPEVHRDVSERGPGTMSDVSQRANWRLSRGFYGCARGRQFLCPSISADISGSGHRASARTCRSQTSRGRSWRGQGQPTTCGYHRWIPRAPNGCAFKAPVSRRLLFCIADPSRIRRRASRRDQGLVASNSRSETSRSGMRYPLVTRDHGARASH